MKRNGIYAADAAEQRGKMNREKEYFHFCCAESDSLYAMELLRGHKAAGQLSEGEVRLLSFMERRTQASTIYLTPAVIYAAANQDSFGRFLENVPEDLKQGWYGEGVVWMRRNPAFLEKFGWRERKNALVAAGILAAAESAETEEPYNQVRRMMRGSWKLLWEKMKRTRALDARTWKEMMIPWADSEGMSCAMAGVLLMMAALCGKQVLERDKIWRSLQKLGDFSKGCLSAPKRPATDDNSLEFADNERMEWLLSRFKNPQRPAYIHEKERFESGWLKQLYRIMELAGLPASTCENIRLSCSEVQQLLAEMEDRLTECQYMTYLMLYSLAKELAEAGRAAAAVDVSGGRA